MIGERRAGLGRGCDKVGGLVAWGAGRCWTLTVLAWEIGNCDCRVNCGVV